MKNCGQPGAQWMVQRRQARPHCHSRAHLKAQGRHEEERDGDMTLPCAVTRSIKGSPPRDFPPFFPEEGKWLGPRLPGMAKGILFVAGSLAYLQMGIPQVPELWFLQSWSHSSLFDMDNRLGSQARLELPSCSLASLPAQPSPRKCLSVCLP